MRRRIEEFLHLTADEISEWLDEAHSVELEEWVEFHLSTCEECREWVDLMQAILAGQGDCLSQPDAKELTEVAGLVERSLLGDAKMLRIGNEVWRLEEEPDVWRVSGLDLNRLFSLYTKACEAPGTYFACISQPGEDFRFDLSELVAIQDGLIPQGYGVPAGGAPFSIADNGLERDQEQQALVTAWFHSVGETQLGILVDQNGTLFVKLGRILTS